ncbi:MAG: hypothetical protein GXY36_07875 [Chloroflexi bacterium]|nr:hypothetical protein [Chloroflexota bacterium]
MTPLPTTTSPESDRGQDWETTVARTARAFEYPPTPDLTRRALPQAAASRRPPVQWRAAWIAIALLLSALALLAVPQVRAVVQDVLRLGGITIALDPQPEPVEPPPLVLPDTRYRTLAGETTLDAARAAVPFMIDLPTYPPGLGAPDRVFVQDVGEPLVILVWISPDEPGAIELALHILGPGVEAHKGEVQRITSTFVNGREAVWLRGMHFLQYLDPRLPEATPGIELHDLVEGNVLLWVAGDLTCRLETNWSLEEAVRLAESLE